MTEWIIALFEPTCTYYRAMGNRSESNNDRLLTQKLDLTFQIVVAIVDLYANRFVLGRQAAYRIGDSAILQFEPVITAGAHWGTGKTETKQGLIEENAGIIAGEWSTGGIRAMHSRCQADHQEPRSRVAERWYRRTKIIGVMNLDLFKKAAQPFAPRTVQRRVAWRLQSSYRDLLEFDDVMTDGVMGQFDIIADTQLLVDSLTICTDGLDAQAQLFRHLLVGNAANDQQHNLELSP